MKPLSLGISGLRKVPAAKKNTKNKTGVHVFDHTNIQDDQARDPRVARKSYSALKMLATPV